MRDRLFPLLPGLVVLVAAIGFLRPHGLPTSLQQPVAAIPVIVLLFGLVFGWYLSSTRMIVSLLVLALAERSFAFSASVGDPVAHKLFVITAFFVPLNLLSFSIFKDDAVSMSRAILRLTPLCLQLFLVIWLCDPAHEEWTASFDRIYVDWLPTGWTPVPQPALAVFLVAAVMHGGRFLASRDPFEAGSLWALAAVFLAYHGTQAGWRPSNFLGAAGFMLFLGLLQSSYSQTYRDGLTGIAGHRAYEEALDRLGARYALAVMNFDQLKSYANAHGKPVAEEILKLVAPLVQAACREATVYRVGGDDLIALFHNCSATDTIMTLERVRKTVESTALILRRRTGVRRVPSATPSLRRGDRDLPVTVSIGVAERVREADSLSAVQKAAYRALYEAKSFGGNVVRRGSLAAEPSRRSSAADGGIVANGEY